MSSFALPNENNDSSEENIKCYLRCKPLTQSEEELGANCISISEDHKMVKIDCSSVTKPEKKFALDQIFPDNSTQSEIFSSICIPMLDSFLQGYNCTIFAYGQTGAGKTHTILGPLDTLYDNESESHGLVPRILNYLFDSDKMHQKISEFYSTNKEEQINENKIDYSIQCSCLEIYQEHIIDLLNSDDEEEEKLIIREDQNKCMYIENLTKIEIINEETAKELLMMGMKNRHVASTKMNSQSSRSHLIFTIFLETKYNQGNGKIISRNSRINIIDLAGSERQKSTQAIGERIKEAGNINKSLSILGNVINALIDPKSKFVPFRDSKLTYLLKDSLGGNSKTMIIANISQSFVQFQETLSTLKFVQRAKMITNKTEINENISDVEKITKLENEIKRLRDIINNTASSNIEQFINSNTSIDYTVDNNDLMRKVNQFIGYEELICKKLKFLDLIGTKSLGQFMRKKQKFDEDIENYLTKNIDNQETKLSLIKQELDLYKPMIKFYSYAKHIENCENTFTNEFISKLTSLHNGIKSFFQKSFGVEEFNKNSMILVDKGKYSKMEIKIRDLLENEQQYKKNLESLENENFLIKMELLKYQNENNKNYEQDDKSNISLDVSDFMSCTPKKEKPLIEEDSENKFMMKLRESVMKNDLYPQSPSQNSNNDKFLILKENYDSALKMIKDKDEYIYKLRVLKENMEIENKKLMEELNQLKEELDTVNSTNEIYKKDLLFLNEQIKDKKMLSDEINQLVNKNNYLVNELSYQYHYDIENLVHLLLEKEEYNESEQIELEKDVLNLRNEKKNLIIEINLLKNDLNVSYEDFRADDVVNTKLRILNRLKKQNENKYENEYNYLINYIFDKCNQNITTPETQERNTQTAISVLNNVLEKIELQNFYLNNQYKENIPPNTTRNKTSNIQKRGKQKIIYKSKSPLPRKK